MPRARPVTALVATTLGVIALFAGPVSSKEIDAAALDGLPPAQVVFLGEVHDNPAHHRNQARAVASIAPAALIFEMLTPEQAAGAATVDRTDAEALARALDWDGHGWPDFALYYPIFAAAPGAEIRGAGVPRAEARAAFAQGAAAVFGAEAPRFGLDRPLPADQQAAREAAQMKAHCNALPEDILPGMVEAQRLRDARLAQEALNALHATGGPVVVITGNGHARRDHGAPALLRLAAPGLGVLSVGQFERDAGPDGGDMTGDRDVEGARAGGDGGDAARNPAPAGARGADGGAGAEDAAGDAGDGDPPFDLWLVTEPAQRPDPCAVFRRK